MGRAVPAPLQRKTRVVADLTFPEFFVVWALRQRQRHGDARQRYVPEFLRAFGTARLLPALDAFDAVVALVGIGSDNTVLAGRYDDQCLSIFEEDTLTVLAALQCDDRRLAYRTVNWIADRDSREAFVRHAGRFATLMSDAGYKVPGQTGAVSAVPAGTSSPMQRRTLSGTEEVSDLTRAETVVVGGFRAWVGAMQKSKAPLGALEIHFAKFGVREGAESLDCILYNLSVAATRQIDVRCGKCPSLSPDEARLLHGVAWLQQNRPEPGHDVLAGWLPPAAVRMTFPALRGLANGLSRAGLTLPVRSWRFPAGRDGEIVESATVRPPDRRPLPTIH